MINHCFLFHNFSRLLAILLLCLCTHLTQVRADALVVTKAMKASTIAEVYITDSSVQVDLEIGTADLKVFADLLPDEVYKSLNMGQEPFEKRLDRFFQNGFVFQNELGVGLKGKITSINPSRRVSRDEITGDPLPIQPQDAEFVIVAKLVYQFKKKPNRLLITPPQTYGKELKIANIGFICYHNEIPVNDFRYLSSKVTLNLDWSDPWYSQFEHPNYRRQFDAPMSAFLYIEPFEVRKEIIVRPRDLEAWIDLGIGEKQVISIAEQKKIKEKVALFLKDKNPVLIDGKEVQGRLDRIHFIKRTLRKTGIVSPAEDLNSYSATLGVIYVYPTDKLPEKASMTWQLFNEKVPSIVSTATDQAGSLPSVLTQVDPTLSWQNFLTNPHIPQMLAVSTIAKPELLQIPILACACTLLFICFTCYSIYRFKRNLNTNRVVTTLSILILIVGVCSIPYFHITITSPFATQEEISNQQAVGVVATLLNNTYRAFDRRDENLVYDRLEKSISGELLSEVYLQTRRSIELENQGGARVSITDIKIQSNEVQLLSDEVGFTANCKWIVSGSVGHWGHLHQRTNLYHAKFKIIPVDQVWKISEMDLLEERRVSNNSTDSSR